MEVTRAFLLVALLAWGPFRAAAAADECPAVFPAGNEWAGKPVCTNKDGKPACFENTTTPCPLQDCSCFTECYNCLATREYVYGAAYTFWQRSLFVIYFGGLIFQLYTMRRVTVAWKARQTQKVQQKSGHVASISFLEVLKRNIKVRILFMGSWGALLRSIWILNPHANFSAILPTTTFSPFARGLLLKSGQCCTLGTILYLCVFWKDSVESAQSMRRLTNTSLSATKKIIYTSILGLWFVLLPCEIVANSTDSDSVVWLVNMIQNSVAALYGLVLWITITVYCRRLARLLQMMERKSFMESSLAERVYQRGIVKRIVVTTALVAGPGAGLMLVATIFNLMFQSHANYHLAFWFALMYGEAGTFYSFAYGMGSTGRKSKGGSGRRVAPQTIAETGAATQAESNQLQTNAPAPSSYALGASAVSSAESGEGNEARPGTAAGGAAASTVGASSAQVDSTYGGEGVTTAASTAVSTAMSED